MNRVHWKWSPSGSGTMLTVRFECLKLEFQANRRPFSSGWDLVAKRAGNELPGMAGRKTVKSCCHIMRREHARVILRLLAGLEV